MQVLRIVAIGGGDLRTGETLPLDRRIVELTGKDRPKALFIPTASFDSKDYFDGFASVYEGLGCDCQPLYLWDGYTAEEIEATIQATKWNEEPHRWEFRGDLDEVRKTLAETDLV